MPGGIRLRLVATSSLAGLVLAAAGGVGLVHQLRHTLHATLDQSLDARAASLAADLRQPGDPDLPDVPPTVARRHGTDLATLTLVYRPDGRVADAQPLHLPGLPLTPGELATARQGTVRLTARFDDQAVRLLAVPVARPDGAWVVAVGSSLDGVQAAGDEAVRSLLLAAPLLVLAVGFGTWLLSGAALRAVDRMRREAADLGDHDPGGRISDPGTGDELAALAATFNRLLDRLHDGTARQRDLVADAGHELRTPLAVLRMELELADRPHRSRAELADAVGHARTEVDRMSRLAEDLLFLARADDSAALVRPEPVDLAGLLEDSSRASRVLASSRDVALTLRTERPLPAVADARAVRRAVDNILSNALTATPAGGTVTLSGARGDGAGGPRVLLRVTDTGPGFPPAFLPHALERFRRADSSRSGGGAGLGLAIAKEIAAAHGGTLRVANRNAGGAEVTLTLPVAGPAGGTGADGTGASSARTPSAPRRAARPAAANPAEAGRRVPSRS